MLGAWPGLYWYYKEIIRALEQSDEQWISSHSQPEADFAQLLAVVPPCRMRTWVCLSSVTFLAPSLLWDTSCPGCTGGWHPLCQPCTLCTSPAHSAPALHPAQPHAVPEDVALVKGGVNKPLWLRQGTPTCSNAVKDGLSTWQVLIIWGIFQIKCSLHGTGESSCHSI